ncbi:hypothetical protein UFOVP646_23 [uncultured Caudovirales phage]|uniref:Uncharacterized protein n=1 Tax=uncultured Caudovirales phage TaxID=2100421 RepID=A0A6J5N9H0_9CAUD|nr:hypothetical protein UFOVP284_33 [uncultured Caudovirales phage]CAB4154676.1 hypothetical protein UFOVP646_23 [uncultured Caudovirales phage]
MSNVQIAIDFVTTSIPNVKSGGVIAFPMFPGATKKDVNQIWNKLQAMDQVAHVSMNTGFAMIRIK